MSWQPRPDSKGKARWTTSVLKCLEERYSLLLAVAQDRTGTLELGVQFYEHLKEL